MSSSLDSIVKKFLSWDTETVKLVFSSPPPNGADLSDQELKPFVDKDLLTSKTLIGILRNITVGGIDYASNKLFDLLKVRGHPTAADLSTCQYMVCWIETYLLPTPNKPTQVSETPALMNIDRFKSLLSLSGVQRPHESVLDRILNNFILRFHAVSSPENAFQLYEFVKDLPSTTTRALLEQDYGIRLNRLYDPTTTSYGNIITGANKAGEPVLIKILMGAKEDITREINVVETLGLESPFEGIVQVKICSVFLEGKDYMHRFSNGKYNCLIMPHYPKSLALLEKLLTFEVILKGGQRIKNALEFIHNNGVVHMDVKPANIFVATSGEWYLGDFGSCVKIGESIVSCSECYLPAKLNDIGKARPSLDFFMLGTCLLTLFVDLKKIMQDNVAMLVDLKNVKKEIELISYEPLKDFILELINSL